MLKKLKALFMNDRNIKRDSYTWNMVQSMLFALQSAILLMVISRTNGLDDAGVFSIAYAVASLIFYIGEYGVRKYQVTDVEEKVSFRDYHTHRVMTCSLAITVSVIYAAAELFKGQYDRTKCLVVIIVCVMKAIEAYCDVFFARFQQKGRLDVASRASTYRIVLPMVCCMAALMITKNLLLSMVVWLIATVFAVLTSFIMLSPEFGRIEIGFDRATLLMITRECLPLFAGSFLLLYVGNAPKYAIDACLDDKAQACFNFIFMPVFVIGLLANFIFNPILVSLAQEWNDGNYRKFRRMVLRQTGVIGGITLLAIAVALTIGCPVLGILFNADLSGSRGDLTVLMVGGGMLALANFIIVVVTVIRKQKYLLAGYVSAAVCAGIFSEHIVRNYGVSGACLLYTGLMTFVSLIFTVILVVSVRHERQKRESGVESADLNMT